MVKQTLRDKKRCLLAHKVHKRSSPRALCIILVFEEGCHVYEFSQITSRPTISRCKEFLIDIVTFCTSLKHSTVEGCHQIYPPIIREQKIRGNTFCGFTRACWSFKFCETSVKSCKVVAFHNSQPLFYEWSGGRRRCRANLVKSPNKKYYYGIFPQGLLYILEEV